jgi:hypothetical protein
MGDKPQQINRIFRKQDSVGVNDAEDDKQFLFECFVDTGDYDAVCDFQNARCLILGRTGVGKTALLTKLQEDNKSKENIIVINPEALAMHHISNSTIIRYMYELGIDMNTFFKLLWRHAICVEIFNQHFKITTNEETVNFIEKLRYMFKKTNAHHLRALNYLEEWRHTFWKKSDDHVTDMISKKETELSGTLGASASGLSAKLLSKEKLSEEQTRIIKQRAQSIVDEVQMREVTDLLSMLNEVIEDQQRRYYVIVDKLDEGWVDDELRYRLIKALVETVRDLNRFDNIKPLVVLRADLLGHVFELTKDSGFQEEKYSSLYLHVRWTRTQLVELIDRRINFLLKSRYTHKELGHLDILPEKTTNQATIDYILDRTLMRPRDVIEFFNIIIREAAENSVVTEQMVLDAARIYSRERLDSIYYEWHVDYPYLKRWVKLLREKSPTFFVGSLKVDDIKEKCLEYAVNNSDDQNSVNDRLYQLANDVSEGRLDRTEFVSNLIYIFYSVGILGVQVKGHSKPIWSYEIQKNISVEDIDAKTQVNIHPCFQSALNVI